LKKQNEHTLQLDVIKTPLNSGEEELDINVVENWKDKGRAKRKSIYLENHPEIRIKSKSSNVKTKKIDIARNGNLLRPIVQDKNKVVIKNTCALDAILQILATSMVDFIDYADIAVTSSSSIMRLAYHLAMNGANMEFYQNRTLIVKTYAKKNVNLYDEIVYDARANTNVLVEKLFVKTPSIIQYNTCNSSKCRQTTSGLPLFPIDQMKLITGKYFHL